MCQILKQSRRRQNAENGLKGRFPSCRTQCNTRNTCTRKTPKIATHTKKRITSTVCIVFFACMHCIFRCFDCVASRATVVLRMTTWKPHVGFQAAVCNTTDATHVGHATQVKKTATYAIHAHEKRNGRKDRIVCVLHELRISVF